MSIRALLLLAVFFSASALAQTAKAYDPLEPPGRLIVCRRTTPPQAAPHGTLQFEFHYGNASFNEHDVSVTYDSAGAPLSLTVISVENPETEKETAHMFAIALEKVDTTARPDSTTGMKVVTLTGAGMQHNVNPQLLTTADVAAGRRLVDNLWKMQIRASCSSTPPSPGP